MPARKISPSAKPDSIVHKIQEATTPLGMALLVGIIGYTEFMTNTENTEAALNKDIARIEVRVDRNESNISSMQVGVGKIDSTLASINSHLERIEDNFDRFLLSNRVKMD